MKKFSIYVVIVLASACAKTPSIGNRVNDAKISASVIADWIIEGRNDFMIIDLRSKNEYEKGHLPGAIQTSIEELNSQETLDGLPNYKKIVFYGEDSAFNGDSLYPVFAKGLHVLIIKGGYDGWMLKVLKAPEDIGSPQGARIDAVAKYLKGESILGTPQPLSDFSAKKFIQKPKLKKKKKKFVNEGC